MRSRIFVALCPIEARGNGWPWCLDVRALPMRGNVKATTNDDDSPVTQYPWRWCRVHCSPKYCTAIGATVDRAPGAIRRSCTMQTYIPLDLMSALHRLTSWTVNFERAVGRPHRKKQECSIGSTDNARCSVEHRKSIVCPSVWTFHRLRNGVNHFGIRAPSVDATPTCHGSGEEVKISTGVWPMNDAPTERGHRVVAVSLSTGSWWSCRR